MCENILLIDDENQTIRQMKGVFIKSGYNAFYSNSEEEALNIINTNSIDMVILYMQQIKINSFLLLKKIKEDYPLALRVVVSGYEDEELVMKVLGNNLAKLFLINSINEDKLINLVKHLFDIEKMLKKKNILLVINSIDELPALENIYYNVTNLIRKDADVDKIAEAIEEDQSIAINVLHIANSAFYGIKTASIKTAINYLGLTNIKNIILASSAFEYLKGNEFKFERELLWNHANYTNRIATEIYKNVLKKDISDTFASSGLLHDIGKVVLLKNYPNEYREILRLAMEGDNVLDIGVEKRFLSVSHEEIGGYLLNWWELPHPIIEAAMFHHDPLNDMVINKELTSVIYIANYYSWIKLNRGTSYQVDNKVFDFLEIKKEDCDKIFL